MGLVSNILLHGNVLETVGKVNTDVGLLSRQTVAVHVVESKRSEYGPHVTLEFVFKALLAYQQIPVELDPTGARDLAALLEEAARVAEAHGGRSRPRDTSP